jgi:hypothetical protein
VPLVLLAMVTFLQVYDQLGEVEAVVTAQDLS